MLMLHRGKRISSVARTLCCTRSSIGQWINWFMLYDAEGLISCDQAGNVSGPSDKFVHKLL
ncbi:helix-turn-helix domain-containing protein, partial [Salmonella enterica]|nr:helix-turn-helix domain-containing protein [Salmonella enterica]